MNASTKTLIKTLKTNDLVVLIVGYLVRLVQSLVEAMVEKNKIKKSSPKRRASFICLYVVVLILNILVNKLLEVAIL